MLFCFITTTLKNVGNTNAIESDDKRVFSLMRRSDVSKRVGKHKVLLLRGNAQIQDQIVVRAKGA